MPGLLYDSPPISSMNNSKRPLDHHNEDQNGAVKRRKLQHCLRHKQVALAEPAAEVQDEERPSYQQPDDAIQQQFTRAILLTLSAVGFDSAKPSALEMFRSATEEYMLRLLDDVRTSMLSARRTQPLPQDFSFALAQDRLTASSLRPFLDQPIPASQTLLPSIPDGTRPEPDFFPPPSLSKLEPVLGTQISGTAEKASRRYIPKHFAALPSKHTWQNTPVFSTRETDPRQIREKATEQGISAERALRELMKSRKGGLKQQRKASIVSTTNGQETEWAKAEHMWEEMMRETVKEDEQREEEVRKQQEESREVDFGFDGAMHNALEGLDIDFGDGDNGVKRSDQVRVQENHKKAEDRETDVEGSMLVNWERRYWRKNAQRQQQFA